MTHEKGKPGAPINSMQPIPTRPFPGPAEHDLTGLRLHGMIIIGYYGRRSEKHRGSQWVCLCQCGRYEVRRSRSLKNRAPGQPARCSVCEDEINRTRARMVA